MTDIGPVEAGMRRHARDVRSRFFSRPDNENAPVDRTERPFGEAVVRFPHPKQYLPKPVNSNRDPRGRNRVEITPEQIRQVNDLRELMTKKHGVDVTDIPSNRGNRKVSAIRAEMAWNLRHSIGLTTTICAEVIGNKPNNIAALCQKHEANCRSSRYWTVGFEAVE